MSNPTQAAPPNRNVILVMGKPNSGKSTSLIKLENQNKWVYLNSDLKELPFKTRFMANVMISDAMDILSYIRECQETPEVEGIALDTLTFLMSMFERQYVVKANDTQKAWGAYGNFYREFIHTLKAGSKDTVVFAHEDSYLNEQSMQMESRVPIKGAVGKTGVEADFTIILSTKQMPTKRLEAYPNDLLHITDEEREDGFKYVFCTRVTKETIGEKMRSPMGLWSRQELYIDNDLDQVFKRIKTYYGN